MRRSLALSIGLCLAVLPGLALAKPRVAMVAFEGDPGGTAQETVGEAISEEVAVVGPKEVNRAVDKLGLEVNDLADRDLKKLANELEADAIIQGKMSNKSGSHLLRFKLFVHGKKLKGWKIEFSSLKSKKFKEKLHDKMLESLGEESAKKKGGDDDEPVTKKKKGGDDEPVTKKKKGGDEDEPVTKKKKGGDDDAEPTKKKKGGDEDEPVTKKKKGGDDDAEPTKKKGGDEDEPVTKKKKGGDDDEPVAKKKKGGDDDGDERPRKKKRTAHRGEDEGELEGSSEEDAPIRIVEHTPNRAAIRLDVGGSGTHRTLSFTSRSFPQAPTGYHDKNPLVGGMRVAGEVYPLAFTTPNAIAAGLGIGGFYDQNLGLKLTSSGQVGSTFPVTERHLSVGARFRIAFGKTATSPTLTLGVGYTRRTFKVNRSGLMAGNIINLPDVDYAGVDPGLEFRIPVVKQFALLFGGQAVLVTSAGPIQTAAEYGQATVTGGQGMVGMEVDITNKFAIRATGEFCQMGFKFTGNGQQSSNRDMVPTSKDVGGAADRYIGGSLTLAVMY